MCSFFVKEDRISLAKGGDIIHKILDENYLDLLVENVLEIPLKRGEGITRINDRYSVLHMENNDFNMCSLGIYPYHTFPSIYILNSTISMERSSINPVRNNPGLSLFGQGVVIGFVDTGIKYEHEAFLNVDGSTRILSIWDQTITEGNPPTGFTFGTEYDKNVINMALLTPDPLSLVPSTDSIGHGTMLAGIAAGNIMNPPDFSGIAPKADIIAVKLPLAKKFNREIFSIEQNVICYQETNILLGIEYIKSVANQLKRPYIICIGMGSSQGNHDGHNAMEITLNTLATVPRAGICIAAGNEGNSQRHYHGNFTLQENTKKIELRVGEMDKNFFMEIWQNATSRLMVEIISPKGEKIKSVTPRFNECMEYNFILEPSKIYINNIIVEQQTGEQLILIRFQEALSGIWIIQVINMDSFTGNFNAWLPAGDIISSNTYFLKSDPDNTITSPAAARNPVTVAAYDQFNNGIMAESSRGFTTNGTVKPDIAAPGYKLPCPIIEGTDTYGTASGTGAAAAHTAGAAAMLMEWAVLRGNYTTITGRDINGLLIRGGKRDNYSIYPNKLWGYGQLDLFQVFQSLI